MKEFTQFASDLDDATKRQLQHGQVLMELLKQPLNHPMSHADMVIVLVVADAGILDDLDSKQVKKKKQNYSIGLMKIIVKSAVRSTQLKNWMTI